MKKHYIPAIICFLIFFTLLVFLTMLPDKLRVFDEKAFEFFVSLRNPFTVGVAKVLSYLGEPVTIVCLGAVLLALPNRRNIGVPVCLSALFSLLINESVKSIVARPRPVGYFLTDIGYKFPSSYSFPSGHSQNDLLFFGLLFFLLLRRYVKKEKLVVPLASILFILSMLIGFSRPIIGVHYPSDVLAGWSLGYMVFFLYLYVDDLRIIGKKVNVSVNNIQNTANKYISGVVKSNNKEINVIILDSNIKSSSFDGRVIAVLNDLEKQEENWIVAPFGINFSKKKIMDNLGINSDNKNVKVRCL